MLTARDELLHVIDTLSDDECEAALEAIRDALAALDPGDTWDTYRHVRRNCAAPAARGRRRR